MYNRNNTAAILGDLRDGIKLKTGKKPSYKELSNAIFESQGVRISYVSLCEYESEEKDTEMSVKNFAAIADYYGVSYDFLLGKTESRSRQNININKKYGLSDAALNRIEIMNRPSKDISSESLISALNKFIESGEFENFIDVLAKCKNALEIRESGMSLNEKSKSEVRATISDEQKELLRVGKMILVEPIKYFDILINMLQNTIPDIAVEVASKK